MRLKPAAQASHCEFPAVVQVMSLAQLAMAEQAMHVSGLPGFLNLPDWHVVHTEEVAEVHVTVSLHPSIALQGEHELPSGNVCEASVQVCNLCHHMTRILSRK